MADPDPLDDRLAALGRGPTPPLAAPAAVRARGDRRRRRQQLALACAAVLAAGTLGGGVALLTGGGQDALRTAGPPTSTPPATSAATPEDDCVVPEVPSEPGVYYDGAYCSTLELELEPPEQAEPEPTPLPPPPEPSEQPAAWEPAAAFLSPQQAGQVELPGWAVDGEHVPGDGPLLDPCGDGAFMGDPVALSERALRSERETGGSRLVQQVVRYAGETEAAAAFDAFSAKVQECPQAPGLDGPDGDVTRFEVAGQGAVDGARTLLVQLRTCHPEHGCLDSYRSYLMLVQHGDGLTDAYYGLGEDGDPADFAAALLDAVAQQLVRSVQG